MDCPSSIPEFMFIKDVLTSKQDDIIHDERQFDREEFENDRGDEYYSDWLGDNISELRKEFCEDNEQAFRDYCKEAFKEHIDLR